MCRLVLSRVTIRTTSSPAALYPSERLTASPGIETAFYVRAATMCCGPWGAEAWISPRLSPSSPHHNLSGLGARHSAGPFLWMKLTSLTMIVCPVPMLLFTIFTATILASCQSTCWAARVRIVLVDGEDRPARAGGANKGSPPKEPRLWGVRTGARNRRPY